MLMQLTNANWKVLRAVARAGGKPVAGTALRLDMSSATRDGTFLTTLVTDGLLARVSGAADKPFAAAYELTYMGQKAAEYGEYDVPWEEIRNREK